MCGIVGYVGEQAASGVLIRGLKRLEYRGYDSAGVAFQMGDHIEIEKSEGKLENVERLLLNTGPKYQTSHVGIGHTRWATHGKPTTQNAHPHRAGHVVLVHNGIIENYQDIRKDLIARGHRPVSETDSELFGFLVLEEMDRNGLNLRNACRAAFSQLQGQCSVVVMSEKEPGVVIGVRNGSPLVACLDPSGGAVVASDAQALIEVNRDVYFLEHGDLVQADREGLKFYRLGNSPNKKSDEIPVKRSVVHLDWSVEAMDKQGFPHYMLKEIHEQPTALVDTLNALMDRGHSDPFRLADSRAVEVLDRATDLTLVACGTSWHSAMVGKYWIEKWGRIPVQVEIASEYRYRDPVLSANSVVIGISQSGETADTLAVIRDLKSKGVPTLGIANRRGSSLEREAQAMLFTSAGPEICVAATKTFSSQLGVLMGIAGFLARRKGSLSTARTLAPEMKKTYEGLIRLPHLMAAALEPQSPMNTGATEAAQALSKMRGFFFMGRGLSFPVALEGALKLKEIAYVHAEGYAAGELKHGPIAMIDEGMAVVVIAPKDIWREKTVSNLEEVKARGATIVGIGEVSDTNFKALCDYWIPIPDGIEAAGRELSPWLTTLAVQLLSYRVAVLRGTDVDKPRNLAKSVTVE